MFPAWRLRLREARVAWQCGRYDEAAALVTAESLRDYLPAKRLAHDLAGKFVQRAGDRLANGDSSAAWLDLAKAERLGGSLDATDRLRKEYVDGTLEEVQRDLAAGQAASAVLLLEKLEKRGLADERARLLHQLAQLALQGDQAAARGHFLEAATSYQTARRLAEPKRSAGGRMNEVISRLNERCLRLESQAAECQRLSTEMHSALAAKDWSAVLSTADALLAIAPQHTAATQARRRAWKAVGMDVTRAYTGPRRDLWAQPAHLPIALEAARPSPRSTHTSRSSEVDTVAGNVPCDRALLWIDAVGGFLVCLDDTIVLGQPSAGDCLAVPILADVSRRHAVIRREAGAYVLEPLQRTRVNGRDLTGPYLLVDNDVIQLGENVRLRFARPHALSATARLTLESHHKTQPSADAVLLMADSCVLGPNRHCHVRCRDWQHDVVIYRQNQRLFCRTDARFTVEGAEPGSPGEIQSGVRVEGEEFSFTWESVE